MENIVLLKKELDMWKRELEDIQNASLIGGVSEGGGGSGTTGDRTGNRAARIVDIMAKIEDIIDDMMQIIEEEPDTLMRQVLNYRCIHGYSWRRISKEIYGNGDHTEALRSNYRRYTKKLTDLTAEDDVL